MASSQGRASVRAKTKAVESQRLWMPVKGEVITSRSGGCVGWFEAKHGGEGWGRGSMLPLWDIRAGKPQMSNRNSSMPPAGWEDKRRV